MYENQKIRINSLVGTVRISSDKALIHLVFLLFINLPFYFLLFCVII